MTRSMNLRRFTLVAMIALAVSVPMRTAAQTPFEPAAVVNDEVITRFDLDQRLRAQAALTNVEITPAVVSGVMGSMISDRLRMQAARSAGVRIDDASIAEGVELFARRRGVTADELRARLSAAGVTPDTIRDIVETELAWREVIRQRYGSRARATEADVERELEVLDIETPEGGDAPARRLYEVGFLSIPAAANASPTEVSEATARLAAARKEIRSCPELEARASEFGPGSGIRSGLTSADIPPPLDEQIPGLVPGQFTDPTRMVNVVAIALVCSVENIDADDQQIEEVRRQLVQRNFQRYADAYLQELRRDAVIEIR